MKYLFDKDNFLQKFLTLLLCRLYSTQQYFVAFDSYFEIWIWQLNFHCQILKGVPITLSYTEIERDIHRCHIF